MSAGHARPDFLRVSAASLARPETAPIPVCNALAKGHVP